MLRISDEGAVAQAEMQAAGAAAGAGRAPDGPGAQLTLTAVPPGRLVGPPSVRLPGPSEPPATS